MAFQSRIGRAVLELSVDGGTYVRGLEDAKANYRAFARGLADTNRDINRQALQFSGRQQIAEAAKMAEAVKRVGGATRLVASDQARVNAVIKQGIEHYKVLGKDAPKAWLDIEKATRRAEQATKQAQQQTGGFLSSFAARAGLSSSALSAGIGGAIGGLAGGAALAAVNQLGQAFTTAASKGSQLVNVSRGFDSLTRSINESGAAMLAATRGATKGLIADLDLMLAANKAILLGLPVTTGEMATLARTAVTLGKAMGIDATTALDNLITGLGRSSPLLLDNLGLIVKESEAHEKYAASLNRTASSLTDAEKKTAFYNAAMEAARKKSDDLGDSALTLTEEFSRLGTATGNVITKWGAGVNQAGYFSRAIGFLADETSRAAENMDLVALAQARLEKAGKDPGGGLRLWIIRNLLPGGGSVRSAAVEREIDKIVQETIDAVASKLDPGLKTPAALDTSRAAEEIKDLLGKSETAAQQLIREADELARKLEQADEATRRAWQQLLAQFNGADQRNQAANLARALSSGQLNLSRMTEEAQQAIAKALEDGAAAWRAWGGVVPAEINRALAAVRQLPQMIAELQALERALPNAPVPEGDVGFAQFDVDRQMGRMASDQERLRIRAGMSRDHAKVLRDIDLSRSEAVIRQAEREGATKAQILVMESVLAQKKRDAEIADAEAAHAREIDLLERGTATYDLELQQRQQAHADHVNQINETWAQGEAERRDMIRRESSFWASELGKRISAEARGALHEATGRLFSTIFAGADGEAKKQAKAAREDYERIAKSGKASAEEITRAYRAMRQAEEAANIGWANRFKSIWDGIKRHLFNIFDQILEQFVNGLLRGMLRAFLRTAIGERIGRWVGGLFGGSSGGGLLGNAAQFGLGQLFGGGALATTAFSTAAGGTLAASMIAPGVASAAVPAAITSQGVSATVAGSSAAGGGAGLSSTLIALASNPITIAAAAVLVGHLLARKFFGSHGPESRRTLERIDREHPNVRFRAIGPNGELYGSFPAMNASRPSSPASSGGGLPPVGRWAGLSESLDRALTLPDTRSSGTPTPAPPTGGGGGTQSVTQHTTINVRIHALDGADVERVWKDKIRPRIVRDMTTNEGGLGSATRRTALT